MDFLENIVNETNRFSGESQVEAGKRNHLWTNPLTVAELKAWLGLLIRMGIKQLLQVSYYWSKEGVYGVPASASLMAGTGIFTSVTNLKCQLNKKLELPSSTRCISLRCFENPFWTPVQSSLHPSKVVTTLHKEIYDKKTFFYSFFTNVPIVKDLLEKQTFSCRTERAHSTKLHYKTIPKKEHKLARGQQLWQAKECLKTLTLLDYV